MQILVSLSLNPYENLALEDRYLRDPKYFRKKTLLVWRSRPAIVMGRFQNPWMECALEKAINDGVLIVRRQSGGGTVFIDEGNINFSFIGTHKKADNFEFVTKMLTRYSIKSLVNERNDIIVDGKKISGSAFKKTKDSEMHHFSLLVETDPQKLSDYLYIPNKTYTSRSIASTRSETLSLSERGLDIEILLEELNGEPVKGVQGEFYEKMMSPEWIFGETPKFEFTHQGKLIKSHKGKILEPVELNLYENQIWNLETIKL